jgi:ankyrin repeat protein
MFASENGHAECVKLLLGAGSDAGLARADGSTALMLASQKGHAECVRLLS